MADRTFWVAPWRRRMRCALLLAPVLLLVVSGLFSEDDVDAGEVGLAVILVACFVAAAVHEAFYRPFLVTTTETGVLLEANARYFFIPWSGLEWVRRRVNKRGDFLVWRHRGVRRIWMRYGIDGRDELRAIVERRAPNADLRGW